ncbi:MAG TPA: DUF3368 domain-containing protein [Tepidisphaeraceae bacterium]|nr:DUF3368 domain-containing protein [Tepidisphaeraceae bacterium]
MSAWIVNASPLILLGKIDRLDLLQAIASQLIVPAAVALEVRAGPAHDRARTWLEAQRSVGPRIEANVTVPPEVVAWDLGAGESAVIGLALARPGCVCVLDDRAARHCAAVFELPVIGTLGVLVKAKRAGLISELRPMLDQLTNAGSLLSDAVVARALALAGEGE